MKMNDVILAVIALTELSNMPYTEDAVNIGSMGDYFAYVLKFRDRVRNDFWRCRTRLSDEQ